MAATTSQLTLDLVPPAATASAEHRPDPLARARHQAERAMERAAAHADQAWLDEALEAVRRTCLRLEDFIGDDVWETGLSMPREARALGPVMMRAARLGYCVRTDRVRPSVRSHGSPKPVWKSRLFKP